jgi:hypothetical protein
VTDRKTYHREWKRKVYKRDQAKLIARSRAYYAANKEVMRAKQKARYLKDHPASLARRRELRFGISRDEYDALLASQDGRCAICGTHKPGGRGSWHLDHRHDLTEHDRRGHRGLLCTKCNVGLGCFGDDPEVLKAAALYLFKHDDIIDRRLRKSA